MSQEANSTSATSLVYGMAELPAVLGVGVGLARKIVRNGDLPARKIGARTIVLREDVERYLRSLPVRGVAA